MSCRAPFQPDDQYEQLRRPNASGSVGVAMPGLEQQAHLFGDFGGAQGYAQVAGSYQAQALSDLSKLSPSASIFVPRAAGPPQQQQQQQQPRHQQYQQAGGSGGAPHGQQQQQRYVNGYNKHHHQQPHYNHHHNHQHKFNNDMHKLTNSVQNRLHLNNLQGSAGNYYQQHQQVHPQNTHHHQQQQHHQQPHQPHNQNAKFQRYTHLNNSFQPIAQQTQPHHQQHNQQQQQYFQNQNQQQQPQPSTSSAAASSSSSNSSQPDMATIALEYLDTVIHCLNQNPGQFDSIASRFLTIFDGMENNQFVLSIAMEDIFEKSIQQPNFRYMGAKLYNLLHMLNPKPDSMFHTLLKCKLDYHQEEVTKYMCSNEQQKVRETALFLAELYMQLRGDDDSRIQLIAVNIVYSLSKLLLKESNENVRCLCQTLKLAGYDLTADCPADIQEIIAALQAIEMNSPGKYPMVASVISLQQNNWGRKVSNALGGDEDTVVEPPRLSDEPVFYGPDGRELTAEETDFLAAEDGDGSDADNYEGDDLEMDAEMDEESKQAFKEFCKDKQKT
ncbi:polyadenylate-binding protein-interacting protein 1 [Drosophila eugracilis]|uniref:polyadenylate-binding protein-interacting protein 1 n=1 Tax=Drosophila eugracilis TaxID=29029 RepID=UPI0007E67D09|nr:polyadenylate-binding protein-interacting protein 1 [Drosophila eugracilis]